MFFLICLWLVLSASPAYSQSSDGRDRDLVVLTGRAHVPQGETVGDLVIFNGPVTVQGTVDGDLVAFNGGVTVSGTVQGDVVAFNGAVRIQSGALVEGDLQSRSTAQISDDAEVQGEVRGVEFESVRDAIVAVRFGVWVAVSISALLFVLALVWLFPRVADALTAGGTMAGATIGRGAALFFGVPILAVLCLVSIVAIPLGIGVLMALFPLYAIGYAASAYWIGRRIAGPPRPRALAALVGVVILRVIALVPVIGGLTWFAATVFGLGRLLVAARRPDRAGATVDRAAAGA